MKEMIQCKDCFYYISRENMLIGGSTCTKFAAIGLPSSVNYNDNVCGYFVDKNETLGKIKTLLNNTMKQTTAVESLNEKPVQNATSITQDEIRELHKKEYNELMSKSKEELVKIIMSNNYYDIFY